VTNILAVIDPRESRHHALERCREQPPELDLDIHAVLFVEHESAEHFAATFKEKTEWLKEQVTPYIADGFTITTQVVPFTNLYESVIEVAGKHGADFVIKPMRQHSLFQTVVRTSTDWNLIRHCPFPLLLVSELDNTRGKPILAAIDVRSGDDNHDTLNDVVLKQARSLARVLGSDTHITTAYNMPTPMAAVGSVDATPYPTSSEIMKDHSEGVAEFLGDSSVAGVHVEEGAPAYAINSVANRLGAGVIVIGTVARKGISGVLIGNTAEGVLESAKCDVLVVKLPD
jgi:universal stress protein E